MMKAALFGTKVDDSKPDSNPPSLLLTYPHWLVAIFCIVIIVSGSSPVVRL